MAGAVTAAAVGVVLNCWGAAAHRYNLPVELLFAIGQVESSHKVTAVGYNSDGSRDLGVMQINSRWLPVLANYGIGEQDLLSKPCTNIQVGAWILAQEAARTGYSWYTIGAYNAGPITAKTSASARDRKIATYRVYSGKVLARWKTIAQRRKAVLPADAVKAVPSQPLQVIKQGEVASADR